MEDSRGQRPLSTEKIIKTKSFKVKIIKMKNIIMDANNKTNNLNNNLNFSNMIWKIGL